MASLKRTKLQHRVWRWHFFAGLIVIPFAIILAITGAIYLFKPQMEASFDAKVNRSAPEIISPSSPIAADDLVAVAQKLYPEATFRHLILPKSEQDPTVEVELRQKSDTRLIWVDRYSGNVLHDADKNKLLMNVVKDIHGTLLAGKMGSYIVELMACWMIVLIITGIYLWWPRGTKWWRFFIPKLKNQKKRAFLNNLHGMGGAWIGGMILILLLSGLPWTQVWGDGFKRVQKVMQWNGPEQEWKVTLQSDEHAEHNGMEQSHSSHAKHMVQSKNDGLALWSQNTEDEGLIILKSEKNLATKQAISLQFIMELAINENLSPPVQIQHPRGENGVWSVRSMTPNRPHRVTIHYDKWSGEEIMRVGFSDHHPVKQITSYGIAMHEGALFGWFNQVLGVISALGVIALSVTGGLMWWKRKPNKGLGVPPMPSDKKLAAGVIILILALGLFLPLVGLSLIVVLVTDLLWTIFKKMQACNAD